MNIYTAIHQTKNIAINRYKVEGSNGDFYVTSLVFTTQLYDGTEQQSEVRAFEQPNMTITLDSHSLPLPKFIEE